MDATPFLFKKINIFVYVKNMNAKKKRLHGKIIDYTYNFFIKKIKKSQVIL